MASRHFMVLLEWDRDDRVWVSFVPALGHLSTYGETKEQALTNTRSAIVEYLEAAAKEGIDLPDERPSDIVDLEITTD